MLSEAYYRVKKKEKKKVKGQLMASYLLFYIWAVHDDLGWDKLIKAKGCM